MTQQPFPAPVRSTSRGSSVPRRTAAGAAGGGRRAGGASYWLDVDQQNFQATVEASLNAPVLLVFYSPSRMPESEQMARDLATVAEEFEGRFLAGLVDVDAEPAIAQAVQLQSVPFVFAVIDGRPQPLIQDLMPLDKLRGAINQVMQQLTAQGITGRHQPRQAAAAAPKTTRRRAPAGPALRAGPGRARAPTTSTARWRSTRSSSTPTRPTPRPPPAWPWPGCSSAPRTSTRRRARAAAAAAPDDVDAQTLVADLDMLGGHVDAAFDRLVELVRRTGGDERNAAREHLLGLFAAVGNEDPRVLKGRQALASALF